MAPLRPPPSAPASAGGGGIGGGKSGGFQSLGLCESVLGGVLKMGYRVPTPIQRRALPPALAGRDVVAMARTGSGKSAAFLIPLLERLRAHSARAGARAVVFAPTRELAAQTLRFGAALGRYTSVRWAALVGGESMGEQFAALARNPDVLVVTPGRLLHLLREVPGFSLKAVELVVFDEADRLFELGFAEQLTDLLARLPAQRQTLLFSATLPRAVAAFAQAGLRDPELVRLDADAKLSEALRLAFFTVRREEKAAALLWTLKHVVVEPAQALVFVATRHAAELLATLLRGAGLAAAPVYGQMDQTARTANLAAFRARKLRVLLVTDVAARGIDLPLLDNVINYDFPDRAKLFVHRVGRVARAGRTGAALSLVAPSDAPYLLDFLLFLGWPATNVYAPPPPPAAAAASAAAAAAPAPGYTLDTMAPSDVHYGSLPRGGLDAEAEAVEAALRGSGRVRRHGAQPPRARDGARRAQGARGQALPAAGLGVPGVG